MSRERRSESDLLNAHAKISKECLSNKEKNPTSIIDGRLTQILGISYCINAKSQARRLGFLLQKYCHSSPASDYLSVCEQSRLLAAFTCFAPCYFSLTKESHNSQRRHSSLFQLPQRHGYRLPPNPMALPRCPHRRSLTHRFPCGSSARQSFIATVMALWE